MRPAAKAPAKLMVALLPVVIAAACVLASVRSTAAKVRGTVMVTL